MNKKHVDIVKNYSNPIIVKNVLIAVSNVTKAFYPNSLNDAVDSMASKLELEDYKAISYNNVVEFEDYLSSLEDLLPIKVQSFLKEFSGLKRMFLSQKDRYVAAYCFDCGFESFE